MSCTQSRGALRSHTARRMPEEREALAAWEGRRGEKSKEEEAEARKEHIKQRKEADEPLNEANQYKGGR